jgi:hypothetical protein
MGQRLSDAATAVAARSFPRSRRADARVVRDCARESIDASGMAALPREFLSLAVAGVRARVGVAARELLHAPWRPALSALTLPLAAAILTVWTFAFVPRYDHWPLGEGWAMLLGGSLVAVVGAALRRRWLTATGAAAVLVAAASPYLGMGTETALSDTPSFYQGWSLDLGAVSLLPTLLLLAGALSMPRGEPRPARQIAARLSLGLAPAMISLIYLLPAPTPEPTRAVLVRGPGLEPQVVIGPPYEFPWIPPSDTLVTGLAIALAVAVVVTWFTAGANPAGTLATGLVLLTVAYPVAWEAIRELNAPWWAYQATYRWPATLIPLVLALALARRAGRIQALGQT